MKWLKLLTQIGKWGFLSLVGAFGLLLALVPFMVHQHEKGPKNYVWLEHVDVPPGGDTAAGIGLARCAIGKIDQKKVRAEISMKNPGLPKEWAQNVALDTTDWSQVLDARRTGVSISIEMPSDEASYRLKPAPFAATLIPLLKAKIEECSIRAPTQK